MNKILKKLGKAAYLTAAKLESVGDRWYSDPEVPAAKKAAHGNWREYLYSLGSKSQAAILEIGSREVTGPSEARQRFAPGRYVGFDFYPGRNVDVVGDAHKLSSYFAPGEQFDIIYTSACFEHFAMPWLVAMEMAKLLKVGGTVLVETHFSFSAHERPWNFFQFSDMGLRVLFSPALGFECTEAGVSNPMVGRFSAYADPYLRYLPVNGLYCHSSYLGVKTRDVPQFEWDQVSLNEVVANTVYPAPSQD